MNYRSSDQAVRQVIDAHPFRPSEVGEDLWPVMVKRVKILSEAPRFSHAVIAATGKVAACTFPFSSSNAGWRSTPAGGFQALAGCDSWFLKRSRVIGYEPNSIWMGPWWENYRII